MVRWYNYQVIRLIRVLFPSIDVRIPETSAQNQVRSGQGIWERFETVVVFRVLHTSGLTFQFTLTKSAIAAHALTNAQQINFYKRRYFLKNVCVIIKGDGYHKLSTVPILSHFHWKTGFVT